MFKKVSMLALIVCVALFTTVGCGNKTSKTKTGSKTESGKTESGKTESAK